MHRMVPMRCERDSHCEFIRHAYTHQYIQSNAICNAISDFESHSDWNCSCTKCQTFFPSCMHIYAYYICTDHRASMCEAWITSWPVLELVSMHTHAEICDSLILVHFCLYRWPVNLLLLVVRASHARCI